MGAGWAAHRLAYRLAHGQLERWAYVRHRCDVKLCCNPDHLELGTARDNALDAVRRGRTNGGNTKRNRHRALWPRVFELAALGWTRERIAAELGMSERNVYYRLKRGGR